MHMAREIQCELECIVERNKTTEMRLELLSGFGTFQSEVGWNAQPVCSTPLEKE